MPPSIKQINTYKNHTNVQHERDTDISIDVKKSDTNTLNKIWRTQ